MSDIYWATLPDGTEIIAHTTRGLRDAADSVGHTGHIAIRTRAATSLELERLAGAAFGVWRAAFDRGVVGQNLPELQRRIREIGLDLAHTMRFEVTISKHYLGSPKPLELVVAVGSEEDAEALLRAIKGLRTAQGRIEINT